MSHTSRLTVRAAALTGVTALCRSYGIEAAGVFRKAGLPVAIESQPDRRVPVTAVNLVFELAALACGRHDFGLRLSELRGFSNLGPISLLARDEPTVGDAMRAIAAYLPLHNDALSVSQDVYDDIVVLRSEILAPGPKMQATDIAVAMQYRILIHFLGPLCQIEQVYLSRPGPADISKYRQVFGQRVTFDAEFDGIVVKAELLDRPNRMADATLRPYASQFVRPSDPGRNAAMAERVTHLLETLLSNRRCTCGIIALQLGISRRTLTRALEAECTSFLAILDAVRMEIAQRHLGGGNRPLGEIGDLLGFSSQSAFSSWFARKFGMSARRWRQNNSAGGG